MNRPSILRVTLTRDRLAALFISLLPFVYFHPAVFGSLVLAPDDGVIFNVPLRTAAAQIVKNGSIPLWNPFIFSGMPLHGSIQAGLLFPLNWWFLFFTPTTAANLMVLTSYSLGALGAYYYARKSGTNIAGALMTGLTWELSGVLIGQISHINIIQTAAMLPWILWAIEGFSLSGERKWGVLLAILVAIQAFVGHPQSFVYSLLLVGAYVVVMAATHQQTRTRYLISFAMILSGILLAAIQILPTFELLRNSVRSDASYEFFTSFSLPRRFVECLFAPYLMGGGDGRLFRAPYISEPFYAEFIAYIGILPLTLAIASPFLLKRDWRTKFWIFVVLVGSFLALGGNAPFGLYRFIYYVPVLNLFRVPARHLIEVELALTVLAGRGLSALSVSTGKRNHLQILIIAIGVLILTILTVTVGRPDAFHLGRQAPVTILRAPELFIPIALAIISLFSIWMLMLRRRRALIMLLLFVFLDLSLWGQFSGWRNSPRRSDEVWGVPDTVQRLRQFAPQDAASYRILTVPHSFKPTEPSVPPSISHSTEWTLWTQPDVYMMYGLQNAAGYDGFGLARYNTLAGEMKVWGELTNPDLTLGYQSRELDILNVKYLLSMRSKTSSTQRASQQQLPAATQRYGQFNFASTDLGVPNLHSGERLRFTVEPREIDHLALVTNMSWSEHLKDGTPIARIKLYGSNGREFLFVLHAGSDTSEWAHDRPDMLVRIRHQRAPVAMNYQVEDPEGNYQGHTYVTGFDLHERATVTGGEITVESSPDAPDLQLTVFRMSLVDNTSGVTLPLTRQMLGPPTSITAEGKETRGTAASSETRWTLKAQTTEVDIYENARALPRAWLTTRTTSLTSAQTLETIRSDRLPDGSSWDPARTVLVEPEVDVSVSATNGNAQVTLYEPNQIKVNTETNGDAILVLSENHYPGWRAYVDGNKVEVLRVNYNLRGVLVPAGKHDVKFVYFPKSVLLGFLVTGVVAVLLALWLGNVDGRVRASRHVKFSRR
ncbi:MAG TPA: YfhO family protein [Pyrinomonadaceae bacterium]|nr:YfhO family protein [Pyrinomonadaceae bacterium]